MSKVIVWHGGEKSVITDPEYINTLHNVKEVAVDGEMYPNVTEVVYKRDGDGDEP
jgi:hypothetical protein